VGSRIFDLLLVRTDDVGESRIGTCQLPAEDYDALHIGFYAFVFFLYERIPEGGSYQSADVVVFAESRKVNVGDLVRL